MADDDAHRYPRKSHPKGNDDGLAYGEFDDSGPGQERGIIGDTIKRFQRHHLSGYDGQQGQTTAQVSDSGGPTHSDSCVP
jgi:hypothetical protein